MSQPNVKQSLTSYSVAFPETLCNKLFGKLVISFHSLGNIPKEHAALELTDSFLLEYLQDFDVSVDSCYANKLN